MNRLLRLGGVSTFAWLAVLAIAGVALAGAIGSSEDVALKISPEGVLEGKTIEGGEPFEMTLHIEGTPDTSYDIAVTYAGGVGTCQADSATVQSNPQGKAVWTCELATAANTGTAPLDGTVTFTVSSEGAEVGSLVAQLSVRVAEAEEPEPVASTSPEPEETEASENHGHCVSYWSHESKEAGLSGRYRGKFVSSIAQDSEAVAPKGNDPVAETCDFTEELTQALAEQEAAEAEEAAEREAKRARKPAKGSDSDSSEDEPGGAGDK